MIILYRSTLLAAAVATSSLGFAQSQLEEIVVTATKRAESAQTIPVSISAISDEQLEARGISEFADFAASIPNLSFGAASDGVLANRSISLRGVQGRNTTGFYIDDVPINETIDPRVLELERIEVLRGPTGTLYGGRSLGGTVRYISKVPDTDELTAKLRAGLSSSQASGDLSYELYGSANIPLSDRVATSFSLLYEDQAGVYDRAVGTISNHLSAPATLSSAPTQVVKDVDSKSTLALQSNWLFSVTDNFTINPRIMYQRAKLDGFPLADGQPGNFVQNRDFNEAEGGEDEWQLYTLTLNYDLAVGSITASSAYFDRETFEFEDSASFINFLQALPSDMGGFGLFPVIGIQPVRSPIFQTLEYTSHTHEVRFTSDFDGAIHVVAGLFYQDVEDNENFQPRNFAMSLGDNFAEAARLQGNANTWPFGDLVFTSARPSTEKELGIFGEMTVAVTDDLNLVLGSRWYDTDVSFRQRQAGLAAGTPLANDQSLNTITQTGGDQQEDGVVFKAALEYQINDDVFTYASVAEGYRIGGANSPIPQSLGCPDNLRDLGLAGVDTSSYDSDDLISYEAGIKADISSSVRSNFTLFYIDFDDIQQRIQLPCGFQFIGNFGAARSQGAELELAAQLNDYWQLNLNLGYTDAEFTEAVANVVAAGDPIQFVPQWTGSGSVDFYYPDVMGDFDLTARLDISYTDESLSRVNSTARVRPAYERINLRLGLDNERYKLQLFIDNLTNDIANLADNRSLAAETPGRPRFVTSRPRTVGLLMTMEF